MTTNTLNIVVSESREFSPQAVSLLRQIGNVMLADLDRSGLLSAVREADVLWIRLRHRIDAEVLDAAPNLKMIVTPTTGLNHVDLQAAKRRGVQVLSLRGESGFLQDIRATAEHTIALMLALLRRVPVAAAHVNAGGWDRDQFKGHQLHEKTIGVVGYGRLGRIVSRYLKAFDARVLTTDPHLDGDALEPDVTLVTLTELLQDADLITLHVNLCDETHQFFGQEQFAAMKPGAIFINTSRGELVDEHALLDALQAGWLAGAALDVLCDESSGGMIDHPLVTYARQHDNLIITPHIGGCTVESMEKTERFLAQRLFVCLSSLAGSPKPDCGAI